jgi:hypothetical protein
MLQGDLIVRELGTCKEISRVTINSPTTRKVERVMMGMLINMDKDHYYIDDSAFDELYKE